MPAVASADAPSCVAVLRRALEPRRRPLIVYSVDVRSIPNHPFGRETFSRREDAERFIEELRKVEPELASHLRIEDHEIGRAA
jgi:hypothetical protein